MFESRCVSGSVTIVSKSQIVNIRRLNHFFQANLIRGSLLGRRVLFNVETQWYQRKVKNQTGVMVIL